MVEQRNEAEKVCEQTLKIQNSKQNFQASIIKLGIEYISE